jgi:hypothetical protein
MNAGLLKLASAATMAVMAGLIAFGGSVNARTVPVTADLTRTRDQIMLHDCDLSCDQLHDQVKLQDRLQTHDCWQ